MENIQHILDSDEKVLWKGKQNRKLIAIDAFTSIVIAIAVFWGLYLAIREAIDFGDKIVSTMLLVVPIFTAVAIIIGIIHAFVTRYYLTTERFVRRGGIIGTDYKSLYHEQMHGVDVNVGLIDKILGTGSVSIDTGKTETYSTHRRDARTDQVVTDINTRTLYENIKNIDDPYTVYKLIQSGLSERKESLYSGRADKESLEARGQI